MAKQKMSNKRKINPSEALKVLANELQQLKVMVQGLMQEHLGFKTNMQDFAAVFDSYVHFNGNSDDFIKHLDKLLEEQKAEKEKAEKEKAKEEEKDDQEGNEQPDGQHMEKDTANKG